MLLKIKRMNHTGDGIGLINNKICFAPKTIPGDIIEIKEEDIIEHKKFNQIIKYKLIEKSKDRIEVSCPYYEECNGCQIMCLSQNNQLKYKKEKVIDIFKKYVGIEVTPEIIKTSEKEYRNKITLTVKNNVIGLYSIGNNEIIPIKKCLLLPNKINNIIPIIQENINTEKVSKIIIKMMKEKIMIQFLGTINKKEVINALSNQVSSIFDNDTLIYGEQYLIEELPPHQFYVSPNSFFQVNHKGTIAIYNKIKEYLGEENNNVLDLYCGTGTIGIYVSQICKKITGIEINKSSVEDAKRNIKLNNISNINILKGDVGTLLNDNNQYDAIIVDPPRSGLDKKTRDILKRIKTSKIIYVSCNPMTLARDINDLKEIYTLKELTLVDMFPNTYHVECVTLLNLKEKSR